jgi:succinate-semialdehyde dehydrogenase/glutarate-semialdehyde dehydrogenase
MTFKSINPFDQQIMAEYSPLVESEVDGKLEMASKAFAHWSLLTYTYKASLLEQLARVLQSEKESLARLITLEMGKTIKESRAEIEKCAKACSYYAQYGQEALQDEIVISEASKSYAAFQPIGAVFAVMPWNFPFWQVFRYAVPTLLAGNVTLLKHAPNVCGCAIAIEEVFKKAGFPIGVFQTLILDLSHVEKVIQSDIVQGVTLTGSEWAGSSVAALAGKHIKKTVLELGGSDPFIVLADADMEKASQIAVQSRLQNAGQSCIAAKRFIVVEKIKEEFINQVLHHCKALKLGNPIEESTTMGHLARLDLAEKVEAQYQATVQMGAKVWMENKREGCQMSPMLISDVPLASPAFLEETFGPLVAIFSVRDEREAVELANKSRFGLGASIWTKDREKGEKLAKQIQAGNVFVNAMMKSDPLFPFGGIKKSGYGRELSHFGMREFLNIKSVFVA